MIRLSFD